MKLLLRPEAKADVAEAVRWYEEQRPGLGQELRQKLRTCLGLLEQNPLLHAQIFEEIRRAPLERFPYSVFYLVQGSTIEVVAILHNARNPAVWQGRGTP
jgi:plasmid stabilization system protein ParE